jgi:hypothetical protein
MRFYQLITTVLTFVILSSGHLLSQGHGTGVGIIIGEPTGISIKGWLSSKSALDAGLAWSFTHEASIHVHADYLIHSFDVFDRPNGLNLYYGIGGRIKVGNDEKARIGMRMVGGLDYMFRTAPFDLFLEIAPILDFVPETKLNANAGFGARFFF